MKATYRDHGGTDLSVVNAARVSFAKGSDWELNEAGEKILKPADQKLIEYLARGVSSKEWAELLVDLYGGKDQSLEEFKWAIEDLMLQAQHWVPFAHTMITMHMVAPVPIARQFFKHKVGFVESEESRRYVSDTPTLYIPDHFRAKADNVKQGSGGIHPSNTYWVERYIDNASGAIAMYEDMIEDGVCPEQARFILPQGCEVQWIWTGNLASLARVYNQRTDPHAQKESDILARQIGEIVAPLFPISWKALTRSERVE